jgi:hypothetical protein
MPDVTYRTQFNFKRSSPKVGTQIINYTDQGHNPKIVDCKEF